MPPTTLPTGQAVARSLGTMLVTAVVSALVSVVVGLWLSWSWNLPSGAAIVLVSAVPAAYAFSRFRFRGSQHLFFWLLTNRMAPGAAFLIPMFTLFSALRLFDTLLAVALAHCLFNLPLAIWILEGFMRGIPKQIDETAFIDGYSFFRFFRGVFLDFWVQAVRSM